MLLLITNRKELGNSLVDLLFEEGIYCLWTPLETGEFFCKEMDTGGVILDCYPQSTQAEGIALANTLKGLYPEMPMAILWKQRRTPPPDNVTLLPGPPGEDIKEIADEILHFCFEDCKCIRQPFSSSFLTVGKNPEDAYYLRHRLELSPVENEILRFLFYNSPSYTSTRALCYLCSPLHPYSKSTMYVLIRRINRRALKYFPLPLIVNEYGKGYRLRNALLWNDF
jgi:hypothetical protein